MEMLSKNKAKYLRQLHQKKFRKLYSESLVSGEKCVKELLENQSNWVEEVIIQENYDPQTVFPSIIKTPIYKTSSQAIQAISPLKSTDSIVARIKTPPLPDQISDTNCAYLLCDGVSDPGNLGTLIRLCDWFGWKIACSADCVEAFNPKTIQASMGSIFRNTPVYGQFHEIVKKLKDSDYQIYAASMHGEHFKEIQSIKKQVALIVGSESHGIRENLDEGIIPIHIPGKGKAESLNVSVATGILMSHFAL